MRIKAKKFEEMMVLVVVQMEILYGLRNGSIDWLRYREGDGELIESDFLESIKEKLRLMFSSFLVYDYQPRKMSFDMCFTNDEEALDFAKGFMNHTKMFNAYRIVNSLDPEIENEIYAVRIYLDGENEKKDYSRRSNYIYNFSIYFKCSVYTKS